MTVPERTQFTRTEILRRLNEKAAAGDAIIGAGCSAGIIAKSAEAGGADLIVVYSTGKSRLMGLATTDLGQPNIVTLGMYDEIANVVDDTPIIGGAHAGDPTFRRLPRLLESFRSTGFDGVINFPSAGRHPDYARLRESVNQGLRQEARMVELAREMDYFTLGYAYTVEHAQLLGAAGVDVLVAHAGWTSGGTVGAGEGVRDLAETFQHVQDIIDAGRRENPRLLCLAHGGSIAGIEDTEKLYEQTDAQGFVGASSIERIPIETAVSDIVRSFGAQRVRDSARALA